MATSKLSTVKIDELKSKLLSPALTSHYICTFAPPGGARGFISARMRDISSTKIYDRLSLACSEASLPGSSLATIDVNNDYHGVSEKHAYRRLYDDRADFTFYVDSEEYYVIRLFESWIGYAVDEQYGDRGSEIKSRSYNYRVNYPENYYADNLSIEKFERSINGASLRYEFINAYPISINSMPVSYDSSQLLKCTVSFTYSRYFIQQLVTATPNVRGNSNAPGVPELSQFTDPALEQSYSRLTNPLSGQGYSNNELESATQRALSVTDTSDITINTFRNP